MKLRVVSTIGQNGTIEAADTIFATKVNGPLISQAIRVYLSNQRQGTSKTKTRGEVARTKKKWFKQKGTGNARHGARTANLFVGGGVSHGPTGLQNWSLKMSATMRRAALASVLSAQAEHIIVCDDINQLDGKTVSAQKLFAHIVPDAKHILVVLSKSTDLMFRSMRNLEKVYVTSASRLTTYEVAYADAIVFTKDSVKEMEKRLGTGETGKTEEKIKEKKAEKKPAAKKPVTKEVKEKPVVKAKLKTNN